MKVINTREFRANLSQYCELAENETVYIRRPGKKLIQLTLAPKGDAEMISKLNGKDKV